MIRRSAVHLGIFLLTLAGVGRVATANSSYTFSVQQREIYEAVVQNDRNDSELAPGMYRIDGRSGKADLILPGEVLDANRANKGVLAYVGHKSGREPFEILSVINGRITLLNHSTSPTAPTTYLTLGGSGRSGLKVVDIVHGAPVALPEIKSLDEVAVYLGPVVSESRQFPHGGRLVLLSIKSPSPLGDGFTIGMMVEWGAKDGKVSVQGQHAWVLGHQFLDQGGLERMVPQSTAMMEVGSSRISLFAPSVVSRFKAQLSRLQENSTIKGWIEQVNRFQTVLAQGIRTTNGASNMSDAAAGVPVFDITEQREKIEAMPVEMIVGNDLKNLGVAVDPSSSTHHLLRLGTVPLRSVKVGRYELKFVSEDSLKSASIAQLPIDRSKTGRFLIQAEFEPEEVRKPLEDPTSYFFFSNGSPMLLVRNFHYSSPQFQVLKLNIPGFHPTDQIHYVLRRVARGRETFQVFLFSRRRERSERAEFYTLGLHEGEVLSQSFLYHIHEGPAMTPNEMAFRFLINNDDVLFDNISPVKGVAAYLKLEDGKKSEVLSWDKVQIPIKTIPYKRVFSVLSSDHGAEQRYLRALKEDVVVEDFLTYRSYDPTGAKQNQTGFYLKGSGDKGTAQFVSGFPLFEKSARARSKTSRFVLQSVSIDPTEGGRRFPPMKVSLIPFTHRDPSKIRSRKGKEQSSDLVDSAEAELSKFKMGVALTPMVETGYASHLNGFMWPLEANFPFQSLAFTQILQGDKGSANEFDVLLFTRHDEKLKGSVDGVYVAHGEIKYDSQNGLACELSQFHKIHRGAVAPGTVKSHLLVDAEGHFYWVEDPTQNRDSSRYRVQRLSKPQEFVDHRVGHVLQLREPDHLKETDMGFVSIGRNFGGRWQVFSPQGLYDTVNGLRDYVERITHKGSRKDKRGKEGDSDEKKETKSEENEKAAKKAEPKPDDRAENVIVEAFERYLDQLASPSSPERLRAPKMIVVEPALKDRFKMALAAKLVTGSGPFNLRSPGFTYFHATGALDDVEIAHEFQYIAGQRKDRASLLYIESDILKEREVTTRDKNKPEVDEKADAFFFGFGGRREEEPYPFASVEASAKANFMVLLASDGRAKSTKGYKKLKNSECHIPALSIVTPQEWREIQSIHANEAAAGVLDNIETNFDFLTSSWTVWPPRTDKAPEDIKALSKLPYRPEEMRVFPTLDRVLSDAANGKLAGKQKIIIVPDDIKPLVQKLILLRWASNDPQAGAWNFSNRRLSLHRIQGGNNYQSVVQDNFRAMRGASFTRNSVFYADLESVVRAGRPVMSNGNREGAGFRIRDPIRSSKGFLMESELNREAEVESSATAREEETLVTADDIRMEIENVNSQIEDLRAEIDATERRLRLYTFNGDSNSSKKLEGQIQSQQTELSALKSLRTSLESRLESMGEEVDNDDSQEGSGSESRATARTSDRSAYPHMAWWIAAEGQAIQPKKRAGWKLKDAVDRSVATILVGTQEELHRLESDMAFESKFFNLRDEFEIVQLEAPDEATKFQLVQQLFERPEVSSLGIAFEVKPKTGLNPQSELANLNPQAQLIYHFINRIDQLAFEEKLERTSAFIRAFIALKNSLTEDLDLRRTRLIDEKFIERLFTRVFPMPLKPEILEPNDPLNRLRDRDQAVRDLQAAGYEGSPDLKRRFFDTFLSQTRPTDTSRPIPNSQILFGGTSTGKTFLLESTFATLGFVEYNPSKPNNEEADYIIIKTQKLTAEETSDPDKMSVKEAIAQILDLMAQPKGARAHIVFDDFHKAASKAVREQLSQFIAAIFEAKQGMYMVRTKDGKRQFEIPVQNLNIYMTLNPAKNERVLKEWVKDSLSGPERLKREVLAALSGDGFTPEESFLARWGDIINLDNFPRSAKVPELVKRVRAQAGRSGQPVLVDPMVVDTLIDRFPQAHARELLSPATAALTAVPPTALPAPIYLVSVRERTGKKPSPGSDARDTEAFNQHDLQRSVRGFTQVDPIRAGDVNSLARFMGFAMRNFRLHVLNAIALEVHMTDILRVDFPGQPNILKNNFLLGMATHVLDNPRLPMGELEIRPEQYGFLSRTQLEDLVKYLGDRKTETPYFPVNLELQNRRDEMDLQSFIDGSGGIAAQPRTRRDVLIETLGRVDKLMRKAMVIYMRIDSEEQLRSVGNWNESQIREWFYALKEQEPEKEFRAVSRELIEVFYDFMDQMHSPDLVTDGSPVSLHLYDQVRLFAYILDKAAVRLPWGQIANFTINASTLSSDMSLGTRTGYREYVGSHQLSLYSMATPEFMYDMFRQATAETESSLGPIVENLKTHFSGVCESLMVNTQGEESK